MRAPQRSSEPQTAEPAVRVGGRPRRQEIQRDALRARRDELELSRPELRRRMEALGSRASVQSISQWERGLCRPSEADLARWALVLGLDARDVLASSKV